MTTNTWTVVKFIKENTVEAVPSTWIVGNTCYWPTTTNVEKIMLSIRRHEAPNTCWPQHTITLFRNGVFDYYSDARKKTKVAEYTSDLNDDEERNSRKFRHKKEKSSSESEYEEEKIPEPPRRCWVSAKSESHSQSIVKTAGYTTTKIDDGQHYCQSSNQSSLYMLLFAQKRHLGQKEIIATMLENINTLCRKINLLLNISTDTVEELRNIKKQLTVLSSPTSELETDSLFTIFNMPITITEDFNKLEDYLQIEDNFKKSVYEFSKIGGNSVYDFIRRVLSLIMTNNLAQNFTWFGTKEKSCFQNLKISEALINAAEKSVNGNKKSVEEAVKKYLRRAKERSVFENKKQRL